MSCRNVYKAGGSITRYGSLQAYRKVLAKKDGHLIHAKFLACLKEWMKQHDENPEQTKLKDKKRLMEVQRNLSTERRQTGEFVAPKMEFVLVDDWDEEDGKYDASKVVQEFVGGQTRSGIWKTKGKKGHYEYVEKEGIITRETTVEEQGAGKLVEAAIEAKSQVLRNSFTEGRKTREEKAVEAPRPALADILGMLGVDGGNTASGQEEALPPTVAKDAQDDGLSDDDEDDDGEATEALR